MEVTFSSNPSSPVPSSTDPLQSSTKAPAIPPPLTDIPPPSPQHIIIHTSSSISLLYPRVPLLSQTTTFPDLLALADTISPPSITLPESYENINYFLALLDPTRTDYLTPTLPGNLSLIAMFSTYGVIITPPLFRRLENSIRQISTTTPACLAVYAAAATYLTPSNEGSYKYLMTCSAAGVCDTDLLTLPPSQIPPMPSHALHRLLSYNHQLRACPPTDLPLPATYSPHQCTAGQPTICAVRAALAQVGNAEVGVWDKRYPRSVVEAAKAGLGCGACRVGFLDAVVEAEREWAGRVAGVSLFADEEEGVGGVGGLGNGV